MPALLPPFLDLLLTLRKKATFEKLKAKEQGVGGMSNFAIESWISSTVGASADDEEEAGGASWSRGLVPRDWSKALDYARNVLLVGKTKARIQFLRGELLSLTKHGGMPHVSDLDCIVY